jgi:hypothetical protein
MNIRDLAGSELYSGKIVTSLEHPSIPFVKTILFEVFSEDFE